MYISICIVICIYIYIYIYPTTVTLGSTAITNGLLGSTVTPNIRKAKSKQCAGASQMGNVVHNFNHFSYGGL